MAVTQFGYGFIESMLEPHAKSEAGMGQGQVGVAFLLMGAAYMVSAPTIGWVRRLFFVRRT